MCVHAAPTPFHSVTIGHRTAFQLAVSTNGLFESRSRFKRLSNGKQTEPQRDMGNNSSRWIDRIGHTFL